MQISLAQALIERKARIVELGTLCNERKSAALLISYEDGDRELFEQRKPKRSFEELTVMIQNRRAELALLQAAIDHLNSVTYVDYTEVVADKERKLTIKEAWLFAQDYKSEAAVHQEAGNALPKSVKRGMRRPYYNPETHQNEIIKDPDVITEATYSPEAAKEGAKKLDLKYRRLDAAIQKANWETVLDLDAIGLTPIAS